MGRLTQTALEPLPQFRNLYAIDCPDLHLPPPPPRIEDNGLVYPEPYDEIGPEGVIPGDEYYYGSDDMPTYSPEIDGISGDKVFGNEYTGERVPKEGEIQKPIASKSFGPARVTSIEGPESLLNIPGSPTSNLSGISSNAGSNTTGKIYGMPPHISSSSLAPHIEPHFRILELVPGTVRLIQGTGWRYVFQPESFSSIASKAMDGIGGGGNVSTPLKIVVDVNEVVDRFDNTYETNEFVRLFNYGSRMARQLAQITRFTTGNIPDSEKIVDGLSKKILDTLANFMGEQIQNATGSKNMIANILAGGRIDLPKLWEDSNFNPQYTFTAHLVAKENQQSIVEEIITPLAAILGLVTPQLRGSGIVYSYPYVVRARIKSCIYIQMGYMSSLEISRGKLYTLEGENTKLFGVDVTMTINSLYSVMTHNTPQQTEGSMPYVAEYLRNLAGQSSNIMAGPTMPTEGIDLDYNRGTITPLPSSPSDNTRLPLPPPTNQTPYNPGGDTRNNEIISPVRNSRITSEFGTRTDPFTGNTRNHNGIDIVGDPDIRASTGGTVVESKWINGYGNTVIIDNGNGIRTLYGHLDSINVTRGQRVNQGDQIGVMGNTGRSTGRHLHFEVQRLNNEGRYVPVNPRPYLSG